MTRMFTRADFWSIGISFPGGGIVILFGPFVAGVFWDE